MDAVDFYVLKWKTAQHIAIVNNIYIHMFSVYVYMLCLQRELSQRTSRKMLTVKIPPSVVFG